MGMLWRSTLKTVRRIDGPDKWGVAYVKPEGVTFDYSNNLSFNVAADFFSEVAEAFREEHRKVQVFSNMEALYAALSLTQSPSALHTPKYVEVLVDDAKHTGQSHIEFTCTCGKVHSIRTQGDLDTFHREWYKPVMEGI